MSSIIVRELTPLVAIVCMFVFLHINAKLDFKDKVYFYVLLFLETIEIVVFELELWTASWSTPTLLRVFLSVVGYTIRPLLICTIIFFNGKSSMSNKKRYLCLLPAVVNFLVASTAFFSKWVFYYDASNIFQRGIVPLCYLPHITVGIYLFLLMYQLFKKKRNIKAPEKVCLVMIALYLVFSTVLETFYDVNDLIRSAILMSTLFYYIAFQTYYLKKHLEVEKNIREKEAEHNRIAIALSQIRPHFIFNTLNSISILCDADPESARESINLFSIYLRQNLESLNRTTPIIFRMN